MPVVPGPCPPEGCPPPTEIVCIETTKVYDFCFQTDTRDNVCVTIPSSCPTTLPSGTVATGTVTGVSCTTVGVVPILNPTTHLPTGFAEVTLMVTVSVSYTLASHSGLILCTFSGSFSFMKTVTLCAPSGTTITCEAPSSSVGPAAIISGQVCASVTICLLIESVATVKLLVPAYGFCTPAPCVVSPAPPFSCPPSPLFPPQCTVPLT